MESNKAMWSPVLRCSSRRERSSALGNSRGGTMAFSTPKDFMKDELTSPRWSPLQHGQFWRTRERLVRGIWPGRRRAAAALFLCEWKRHSQKQRERNEEGGEGKSEEEHMFASVWSLKGTFRMAGWVRPLVSHSLPFRHCFHALTWPPLVRSTGMQDACLAKASARLWSVMRARQPAPWPKRRHRFQVTR